MNNISVVFDSLSKFEQYIFPPFWISVEVLCSTYLILYPNECMSTLYPISPLLYWMWHCTEYRNFPTIVILSSSEQEKHSSGSGKLFFFLPQFSFLLF